MRPFFNFQVYREAASGAMKPYSTNPAPSNAYMDTNETLTRIHKEVINIMNAAETFPAEICSPYIREAKHCKSAQASSIAANPPRTTRLPQGGLVAFFNDGQDHQFHLYFSFICKSPMKKSRQFCDRNKYIRRSAVLTNTGRCVSVAAPCRTRETVNERWKCVVVSATRMPGS